MNTPISGFRLDDETRELLAALAQLDGVSMTDVVRVSVRNEAARRGVAVSALGRALQRAGAAAPSSSVTPKAAALMRSILEVVNDLDVERHHGGLVPLPEIRAELRRRGERASRVEVDAALEELERDFAIDLSIAQSPTEVKNRAAGIERQGRGLAYWVVPRRKR